MSLVNQLAPVAVSAMGGGTAGSFTGESVRSLFSLETNIKKILRVLGVSHVPLGSSFKCLLHEEERPSAAIMQPKDCPTEPYFYIDFHEREEGRRGFPLGLVYYRSMTGQGPDEAARLPKPSLLIWSLRLLRDAGVIKGVRVDAPRLPNNVSPETTRVFEGFCDLLSLRFLLEAGQPSPYTWRFIQGWTGLPQRAVEKAMNWLMSRGYLRFVGYFGDRGLAGKIMLFLLGTRRLIRRRMQQEEWPSSRDQVVASVAADIAEMDAEPPPKEGLVGFVKAALRCLKCGPVREWFKFDDLVTCGHCFQQIDSS